MTKYHRSWLKYHIFMGHSSGRLQAHSRGPNIVLTLSLPDDSPLAFRSAAFSLYYMTGREGANGGERGEGTCTSRSTYLVESWECHPSWLDQTQSPHKGLLPSTIALGLWRENLRETNIRWEMMRCMGWLYIRITNKAYLRLWDNSSVTLFSDCLANVVVSNHKSRER